MDPYQGTQWMGIGIHILNRSGFDNLIEVLELPSHQALPELEKRGTRLQFAFVDGWHTFDHALTDFFHIDRILDVGGVLVSDDVFFPGVHQACRYVAQNRAYAVVGSTDHVMDYKPSNAARALRQAAQRLGVVRKLLKPKFVIPDEELHFTPDCRYVAFEKVSEDTRGWTDHREF